MSRNGNCDEENAHKPKRKPARKKPSHSKKRPRPTVGAFKRRTGVRKTRQARRAARENLLWIELEEPVDNLEKSVDNL